MLLMQGTRNTGLTLPLLPSLGERDTLLPLNTWSMNQSLLLQRLDLGEAPLPLQNRWVRHTLLWEGLGVRHSLGDWLTQALLQLQRLWVDHVLLLWSFNHRLRGASEVMSRLRKI